MPITKERHFLSLSKRKCTNWKPRSRLVDTILRSKWTKILLFYKSKLISMWQIFKESKVSCQRLAYLEVKKLMNSAD